MEEDSGSGANRVEEEGSGGEDRVGFGFCLGVLRLGWFQFGGLGDFPIGVASDWVFCSHLVRLLGGVIIRCLAIEKICTFFGYFA